MTNKEVKSWLDILIQDYIYEDVEDELIEMRDIIYSALDTQALEQEPCEDAISRTDAMDTILCYGNEIKAEVMDDIKASMIKLSPVTPQPKMGHWIAMSEGFSPYKCSECEAVEFKKSKYCPNCGAKMTEGSEKKEKSIITGHYM